MEDDDTNTVNPDDRLLMGQQADAAAGCYRADAEVARAKAEFQAVRAEMLRRNIPLNLIMQHW